MVTKRERLTTKSEWPQIVLPILVVLTAWYFYNVHAGFYGDDPTEGGRYRLVTYGSDSNPARREQLAIFDRYHETDQLRVKLIPGGSIDRNITTTIAAGTAPDVIDIYNYGSLRLYAEKGMIVPINEQLKRFRDQDDVTAVFRATILGRQMATGMTAFFRPDQMRKTACLSASFS
jgi:hypothetical protein